MTRRKHPVVAAALLLALAGCGGSPAEPVAEREPFDCPKQTTGRQVVTIFHETHTHGRLAGTHEREHSVPFARYVGLRSALRDCLPEPAHSLFVGNGDDLSVDLNGVVTEGEHTIAAFNAAEIDADTFGFSELNTLEESAAPTERSLARLRELVAASDFPWVSANVREGSTPGQVFGSEQGARLWIIRDVGGVRVGITGLLGARGLAAVPPGLEHSIRVIDPVHAMREVLPPMNAAGAQLVVLLSHMDHALTLRVARLVDGIDVALGTHLGEATPRAQLVNGTIVAIAGPDELQALGQLDLVVRRGRMADYVWQRHILSPSDPIDRKVQAVIADYLRGA